MSKAKFSIHSPEGRKLMMFCGFALLFSATVLLFTFDVNFSGLIPSQERLDDLRREEKKAIAAWKTVESRQLEQTAVEDHGMVRRMWRSPSRSTVLQKNMNWNFPACPLSGGPESTTSCPHWKRM